MDRDNHEPALHSDRLHIVPEIKIVTLDSWQGNFLKVMENLLTAVLEGRSQLKKLDVRAQSESERLLALDTALLSQAILRLEECSFSLRCSNNNRQRYGPAGFSLCSGSRCSDSNFRQLSTAQLVGVFTGIGQTDNLKLRSLNFPHLALLEVPEEVLVAALVRLEKTDILHPSIQFSSDLTTSFLTKIAGNCTVNVKRLELTLIKCSKVPAELFGEALVRIETVDLSYSEGTSDVDQVSALFSKMAGSEEMRLRKLELTRVNISHISPDIVSQAAANLEIFNALDCELAPEQVAAIFTKLSTLKNHKLRVLKLNWNKLTSVPTEALAGGIHGLEELDLRCTKLTTEQITGIFAKLSTLKDHKLRVLRLDWNYLSLVPPETLVAGISGLEEVGLVRAMLTTGQVSALLTRLAAPDHQLRSLNLDANNLSSVPTESLVGGISGLERVCLYDTWLTVEHVTGIYRMIADRKCSRLRQINLGGNNRISISPELRDAAKLNEPVKINNLMLPCSDM